MKAAALNLSAEITRAGIRDTARTLREHEARLTSLEAHNRSTAAAIAVAERNCTTYISQLCVHSRQPPSVPAAQQPPALTNLATSVAPAAQQSPTSPNLATFVAPAAQQPLAPATYTVSTALAATHPLAPATSAVSTALAATQPLAPSASTVPTTLAATQPLALGYHSPCCHFFSSAQHAAAAPPRPLDLHTLVGRDLACQPAAPSPTAFRRPRRYLPGASHLKVDDKNRHFPSDLRLRIKELALDVNTALLLLHGGRYRLRYALDLATQDRTPLSARLVDNILHLRDLLERAYGTPDGARWVRETLRDAAASPRPDRAEFSASNFSTTTGQRRREEPSSGRGNTKRAILSETLDSDSHQHPQRAGRDRLNRQVPPRIFHASEHDDSDAPPFPPRISRHREDTQRLFPRVANSRIEEAPGADSPHSLQHMVEAVTAAALAAVDRHLAHMGLYPRSEPAPSQAFMNHAHPLVAPASVATPPPPAGSMIPTTHPAAVSTDSAYPFVTPASVATPPPLTGSVAPTTPPWFRRTMLTSL